MERPDGLNERQKRWLLLSPREEHKCYQRWQPSDTTCARPSLWPPVCASVRISTPMRRGKPAYSQEMEPLGRGSTPSDKSDQGAGAKDEAGSGRGENSQVCPHPQPGLEQPPLSIPAFLRSTNCILTEWPGWWKKWSARQLVPFSKPHSVATRHFHFCRRRQLRQTTDKKAPFPRPRSTDNGRTPDTQGGLVLEGEETEAWPAMRMQTQGRGSDSTCALRTHEPGSEKDSVEITEEELAGQTAFSWLEPENTFLLLVICKGDILTTTRSNISLTDYTDTFYRQYICKR